MGRRVVFMTAPTAYERMLDALHEHGTVRANGTTASARCPSHEDHNPSLSLRRIEGSVLLHCHAGCGVDDVLAALGLGMRDLYDDPAGSTYRYDDGRTVHRSPGKKFHQSGNTGSRPQLYRLTQVVAAIAAKTVVFVTEGEKDVHALESLGAVATCSPMGASNAGKADWSPLHGAHVVLVPDRDEAGQRYVRDIVALLAGQAASLRVKLPAPGFHDAADHIAAGHGLDELVLAEQPDHQAAPRRPWQPVDLSDVLDGTYQPPQPAVGRRTDGVGLFYPGKCHVIVSETEAGKTWLVLSSSIDEVRAGNHVVYIDFEDDESGVVGRLLTLGVDPDTIREYFHYLRPTDQLGTGIHRDDLHRVLTEHQPTLAILDGITEAMTMHGLNPLDNADAAKFGRMLPRYIAAYGAASVSCDHVTKDRDGRGRYALGAVHKLNALDGAQYTLENRTPFGIGLTGRSTIKLAKDRPGQLRKHGLPSSAGMVWYGDLVLDSHGDSFAEVSIEPPTERADGFRPTVLMGRISDALTEHGPLAQRRLDVAVTGRAASIRAALDYLILDGYVSEKTPHELLKPYSPEVDSK